MMLMIATASSAKAASWKNRELTWEQLRDRLAQCTRTAETVAEYKAMGAGERSRIKDVGGFVGGYCREGSRKQVLYRSVLCLDADFADADLWPDWETLYGCAAVAYSTHTHTPEHPRLRLVIPLGRRVEPDEYQAIGRRVAGTLGILKFDDTTYEHQRLMFWPSVSSDGEWIYKTCDGPLLNPDEVLSTYDDWRDSSTWPDSGRVAAKAKREAERQQDPTTKKGLVGAFCRAYGIRDAIEAWVPDYQPTEDPDRYTYAKGSTACGVVIYQDLYSYSHHATDPASGQLCNAWDLVRIHRFGELDADCGADVRASDRPSYKAMVEAVRTDGRVQAQVTHDNAEAARNAFDQAPAVDDADGEGLRLTLNGKGAVESTIDNVVIILQHDPALRGRLALNEMEHSIVCRGSVPWDASEGVRAWTDADDAGLRYYLEKNQHITGKDKIFDAVNVVAGQNRYHPVRDYLDGLSWDGTERLDALLIDYLGAADSDYTRAVTRKTLCAAVARIYKPGTKFDYMLTLRGSQGKGKSTLCGKLGMQWYSDSFSTVQGKESYEQVLGVWLMEVGELAGLKKAEAEQVKLFISKDRDRFRPAYGRRTQEFPRQCIFVGTTNEGQFLRDTTGNRRYWVVDLPGDARLSPWDDFDAAYRDQVWAEAKARWMDDGEPLYLSRELEEEARRIQEAYELEDPKRGLIEAYLDRKLPSSWAEMDVYERRHWLEGSDPGEYQRGAVCVFEIWCEALGRPKEACGGVEAKEVRAIMDRLPGWKRVDDRAIFPGYGQQRYFRRVE